MFRPADYLSHGRRLAVCVCVSFTSLDIHMCFAHADVCMQMHILVCIATEYMSFA